LLGHPWIGQLLTTAAMCAALCWMLQAWLPPTWALLGASLAVLQVGILSYWMNSYFGSSLPAVGGILVLGTMPRIRRYICRRDGLLLLARNRQRLRHALPSEPADLCHGTVLRMAKAAAAACLPSCRDGRFLRPLGIA